MSKFPNLALNNGMDMKLSQRFDNTAVDGSDNNAIYVKMFIVWK